MAEPYDQDDDAALAEAEEEGTDNGMCEQHGTVAPCRHCPEGSENGYPLDDVDSEPWCVRHGLLEPCTDCAEEEERLNVDCPTCDGEGVVFPEGGSIALNGSVCTACDGEGRIRRDPTGLGAALADATGRRRVRLPTDARVDAASRTVDDVTNEVDAEIASGVWDEAQLSALPTGVRIAGPLTPTTDEKQAIAYDSKEWKALDAVRVFCESIFGLIMELPDLADHPQLNEARAALDNVRRFATIKCACGSATRGGDLMCVQCRKTMDDVTALAGGRSE